MIACFEKSWIATGTLATSALPPVSAGSNVPERMSARRGSLFQPTSAITESPSAGRLPTSSAVPELEIDEIPVETGIEARGEARCDVGGEHGGAEEHVGEALGLDELGEDVDPRLRKRRLESGIVGDEDARGSVAPDRLGHALDAGAEEHRGDVVPELRRLAEDAE